jgi:hypothetical protein
MLSALCVFSWGGVVGDAGVEPTAFGSGERKS